MSWRTMRGQLHDRMVGVAWVILVFPAVLPKRHDAWVVRVEPEPDDVAAGRSFEPYYIPECKCGWDDPFYDDAQDARVAAEEHAKGRVEPDHRQRFEQVTD